MSKQFWGILIAIILVFVGVVAFSNSKEEDGANGGKPTNHVVGKSPKGVKLIEYGDFQCPGCGGFHQTVKEVEEKYKDSVQFQFRHLPLTSIHPNAFAAARAAEAAGKQGKFWEMHDLLFAQNVSYYSAQQLGQNVSSWVSASDPVPFFNNFATQLGLKLEKFKQDFRSTKVNNAVNADIAAFKKTGDNMATPTFYLNGKKVDNEQFTDEQGQPSVEAMSKVLDKALKESK